MKKYQIILFMLAASVLFVSCAHYPYDQYNTQRGAAVGAGLGALIGQAIGGNTEGTLIGLAAGTIIGALVGNAEDQEYQAARDAARYNKPVVYYDEDGHAVEALPEASDDPNCHRVRKRVWENGELIRETVEEVCGTPVVRRYYSPPPPVYLGWPVFPSFSFYYGGRGHGYYGHHYPYGHRRHW